MVNSSMTTADGMFPYKTDLEDVMMANAKASYQKDPYTVYKNSKVYCNFLSNVLHEQGTTQLDWYAIGIGQLQLYLHLSDATQIKQNGRVEVI